MPQNSYSMQWYPGGKGMGMMEMGYGKGMGMGYGMGWPMGKGMPMQWGDGMWKGKAGMRKGTIKGRGDQGVGPCKVCGCAYAYKIV